MTNCLNANAYYLFALLAAGLLSLGFRWGWARAVTKYEYVRKRLAEQTTPIRFNRRTPCHPTKFEK